MKIIKNGLLVLAALLFVVLGAAMPYLVSKIQDISLSGFQKNSELNSVSLKLQQGVDNAIPALEMISKEYTETPWEGKTALTQDDARQSAQAMLKTMELYGLSYSVWQSESSDGSVEPFLLVAEDGSSALVWQCAWDFETAAVSVTVDDSTRKAVRLLDVYDQPYDGVSMESIYIRREGWLDFLQNYFGCTVGAVDELETSEIVHDDGHITRSAEFHIALSPNDGLDNYDFNLVVGSHYTFFNYK